MSSETAIRETDVVIQQSRATTPVLQPTVHVVSETNMIKSGREWFMDTSATCHICGDEKMFSSYSKVTSGEKLFMGNSSTSKVEGKGQVTLKLTSDKELVLTNVLHVPDIRENLISGSLFIKHGFKLVFEADMFVLSKSGIFMGKGYLKEGLFKSDVMVVTPPMNIINKVIASSSYLLEHSDIWHHKLGHVNHDSLRKLMHMELIPKVRINKKEKCQNCVETKQTRTSFQAVERDTKPLGLVHSDICDFKSIASYGGKKYFITFIDEAFEAFQMYKNEVENQLEKKIKILKSDRGGEYVYPFKDFCAAHRIIHQVTPLFTPRSNGIAERKNWTLKEMMNALLIQSGLPDEMWREAVLTAN